MEKIQTHMIFEILGRPAEDLPVALNQVIDRMASEKGVKILGRTVHEPIQAQDSKTLFTTFAEVEIEFDSIELYIGVLFAYMPASVEVSKPEKLTFSNSHLTEVGNLLVQRLHHYDAITKQALYERETMLAELKKVAPHLFKPAQQVQSVKEPEKKPEKSLNKKKSNKKKKG